MKTNILKLTPKPHQRLIVMSDIHGNRILFHKALQAIHFTADDLLIIDGDLLEKGDDSLGLLHDVMAMAEQGNTFWNLGNCDDLLADDEDFYAHPEDYRHYFIQRPKTLINEMAHSLDLTIDQTCDIQVIMAAIYEHYAAEKQFIAGLPSIIDTPFFTFVHAGRTPAPLDQQDYLYNLTTKAFLTNGEPLDKWAVVGHWPVCLYHKDCFNYNAIVNADKKMIAIDGGNVLKQGGQLNILILQDENIQSTFVDNLEQIVACDEQTAAPAQLMVSFPDYQVDILEDKGGMVFIRHQKTGQTGWIERELLNSKGTHFKADYCDYRLAVAAGEILHLVYPMKDRTLVKKDGIEGWYYGRISRTCCR